MRAARGALAAASASLSAAQQPPAQSAVLAAQGRVLEAQNALDAAKAARDDALAKAAPQDRGAVQREQDALVAIAQNNLDVAGAQLAEVTAPKDTTALGKAVADAQAELTAATNALNTMQSTVGIRVPRGEVVFIGDLPRRVEKVNVVPGAVPNGSVLSLSSAALQVVCSVSASDHSLLAVGAAAHLDEPTLGIDADARVTYVADNPGTLGAPAGTYAVRLAPNGDGSKMAGANVRVSIPIKSTEGAVLAVPLAALYSDAAGTTKVRVVSGDVVTDVPVDVGLAADGYAEVRPAAGGRLAEGDEVVVGRQ